MLTPQFSLRRLLLIVTVCAVLCLVPVVASRGYIWAVGLVLALAGAIVLAAIQIVLFAVVRGVGVFEKNRSSAVQSRQN